MSCCEGFAISANEPPSNEKLQRHVENTLWGIRQT
jgi:hypothetical protein